MSKVLLVCDRTGGHIFPALALGKKIRRTSGEANEVSFFATSEYLNDYLVKENFPVYGKSFAQRNIFVEGRWRFKEAIDLLRKIDPRIVIGFGGRDSFFLVLFAALTGRKTAIYEPNLHMGKANRVLSFFVNKVWRGFSVRGIREKAIGIPLRENIKKMDKAQARKMLGFDEAPVLVCVGGSQGSSFLNHQFVELARQLPGEFQIVHLTGKREYDEISKMYDKVEKRKFIKDFYGSMEIIYSAADVVISRAGASTLGELSYFGLPSMLIPHPQAGGHQKENALFFQGRGAAFAFEQKDFSFGEFKLAATRLLTDADLRKRMGQAAQNMKLGVSFDDFCNDLAWLGAK